VTRRRVVVLFGGRSAEHEISCISARSVIDALDPERNDVIAVGITREGRWHVLPGPPALPSETGVMPEVTEGTGPRVELAGGGADRDLVLADGTREPIDVVFPVLHGPFGEDGAVQGLLELAGVPYVGAGVLGSALGMDKAVQKVLFEAAGLAVAPWFPVHEPGWAEDPDAVMSRAADVGFPLFVKPATLGSSVGITKAHGPAEFPAALQEAFRYARKAVVERAVEPARELECAVLGNDDPTASVLGEIVPQGHEFYDYAAKYLDESGAHLVIPAAVEPTLQQRIQRMAVTAFRAVECWGMARVDFFLGAGDEVLVNEINTIPGFTSISMYPKLWAASGLDYPALIDRLLDLAAERFAAERAKGSHVRELHGDS
jgi:D-alanine-D-alanine ligase